MENEETQTTAPTQVLTTTETPSGASTTGEGGGDAGTTETTETPQTETPQTGESPVVPEGYVPATEVESERTARTAAEEARTAAETARAEADAARTEAESRAAAAEKRAREAEIKSVARALNFNDAEDALTLVPEGAEDIEATLKGVLEKKPYFARQDAPAPVVTPTSPTNPARGETLTVEALRGMTQAQVAALPWAQVKAALAVSK
ncbi:MAG: hypothetical protein ABW208_10200 [Pyrinomonadaceae bacterium]